MSIEINMHMDRDATVRAFNRNQIVWLEVRAGDGSEVTVFLPRGTSMERAQTIVDAFRDAMDVQANGVAA